VFVVDIMYCDHWRVLCAVVCATRDWIGSKRGGSLGQQGSCHASLCCAIIYSTLLIDKVQGEERPVFCSGRMH
jgi:hypothetical protein